MECIGKTSALTHWSKSGLGQKLAEEITQLLSLRAATAKCIMLTTGTMTESLSASKWCQHHQLKSVWHFRGSLCEEHMLS